MVLKGSPEITLVARDGRERMLKVAESLSKV
jgi:hypothetical protein